MPTSNKIELNASLNLDTTQAIQAVDGVVDALQGERRGLDNNPLNLNTNNLNNPNNNDTLVYSTDRLRQSIERNSELLSRVLQNQSQPSPVNNLQDNSNRINNNNNPNNQNNENNGSNESEARLLKRILSTQTFVQGIATVDSMINSDVNYTRLKTQGKGLEAQIAQQETYSNLLGGGGTTMLSLGAIPSPLSPLLLSIGGLMEIAKVGNDISIGNKKKDNAYTQGYQEMLPTITGITSAFGGNNVAYNSADKNNQIGIDLLNKLSLYNHDTGLDLTDFARYAQGLASKGINDVNIAGQVTQTASKISRLTNGDMGQYMDFMATMARYGSTTPQDDIQYAYTAMKSQKLDDNKFPEFLSGLQKVIEDGIAKGYVKSTKDVSDTLSMFNKMSGNNPLWTGEQGAKRVQSINNGLSSMTDLSDTPSLLTAKIIHDTTKWDDYKDASWYTPEAMGYNTLALMEQGITKDNIRAIRDGVNNLYDGDTNSQIEYYKKLTGLNYTGAMEFRKYVNGFNDENFASIDVEGKLKDLKSLGLVNDETKMQNLVSDIRDKVAQLGQPKFTIELTATNDLLRELKGEVTRSTTSSPVTVPSTTTAPTREIRESTYRTDGIEPPTEDDTPKLPNSDYGESEYSTYKESRNTSTSSTRTTERNPVSVPTVDTVTSSTTRNRPTEYRIGTIEKLTGNIFSEALNNGFMNQSQYNILTTPLALTNDEKRKIEEWKKDKLDDNVITKDEISDLINRIERLKNLDKPVASTSTSPISIATDNKTTGRNPVSVPTVDTTESSNRSTESKSVSSPISIATDNKTTERNPVSVPTVDTTKSSTAKNKPTEYRIGTIEKLMNPFGNAVNYGFMNQKQYNILTNPFATTRNEKNKIEEWKKESLDDNVITKDEIRDLIDRIEKLKNLDKPVEMSEESAKRIGMSMANALTTTLSTANIEMLS